MKNFIIFKNPPTPPLPRTQNALTRRGGGSPMNGILREAKTPNAPSARLLALHRSELARQASSWARGLQGGKFKLLLHICCIGCGAYVVELLKKDYNLTLYFFNPNIFPYDEYGKRLEETKRIAENFGLKLIEGEYNHKKWLDTVRGLEKEPEGGARCMICYKYRLEKAARLAKKENCRLLATTLSISPHKSSAAINEIGAEVGIKYGIKFLEKDFKEDGGFQKSCHLSKELGLYRQNYCGCEFSL